VIQEVSIWNGNFLKVDKPMSCWPLTLLSVPFCNGESSENLLQRPLKVSSKDRSLRMGRHHFLALLKCALVSMISMAFLGCGFLFGRLSRGPSQDETSGSMSPVLYVNDPVTHSTSFTNSSIVAVAFSETAQISRWCISETQVTRPRTPQSVCAGGTGSSNGWYLSAPTTIQLSAGDGLKSLYLWTANPSLQVSENVMSRSISLMTTIPLSPTALSLLTPASSPANVATPLITVSGTTVGHTIRLYADSSCAVVKGVSLALSTSTTVTVSPALAVGSYIFYADATDAAGNVSTCSTASVAYVFSNTHTVTPSGTHVTLSPSTAQTVNDVATQTITVTADTGYTTSATVGGTCPAGSWAANVYTTGAITANCTVVFTATALPFAYIIDGPSFDICSINSTTGALGSCATNTPPGGNNPIGMSSIVLGGVNYFYFGEGGIGVYRCAITTPGVIGACTTYSLVGSAMTSPGTIDVKTIGAHTYAYITQNSGGVSDVFVCPVSTVGVLDMTGCVLSNGGATFPYILDVRIATIGVSVHAYVSDLYGLIYVCSVSTTDGTLSSCTGTNGGTSWNFLSGMTVQAIGSATYLYVADQANNAIWKCTLNATTGNLTACALSNGGVTYAGATGVGVYTSGPTPYAYITDGGSNQIYQCSVNTTDGSLSGCASPLSFNSWFPSGWIYQ
jgi:hypothetical protein